MRQSVTTIPGLVAAVSLCLATTLYAQAPAAMPVHASSAVLDLGPLTLSSCLEYFSGQTVHIPAVRVDRILSPRLFIVEPANMPPSANWYGMDSRALVVLAAPTSTPLQRGTVVEIVGQPWSLYEAQLKGDQGVLSELNKKQARRFQHKPVIQASLVRTPGGIELAGH
jgi:hypothetical protein